MYSQILFALLMSLFAISSQNDAPQTKQKVNWISMDEAAVKMKTEARPVLIDLYTDWCYWCKVMDKRTYNNQKVVSYINDHFYAVRLNAETKGNVFWKGKNYQYNAQNKVNDFALYATQGQLAFPNTVIFSDLEYPASIPGFMEPKEIEAVLKYFGSENYKKENFNEFSSKFKNTW
jgi:thioredoxin-related protein